nr:hypothetical protein CFP56_13158 [Quercus suber]
MAIVTESANCRRCYRICGHSRGSATGGISLSGTCLVAARMTAPLRLERSEEGKKRGSSPSWRRAASFIGGDWVSKMLRQQQAIEAPAIDRLPTNCTLR